MTTAKILIASALLSKTTRFDFQRKRYQEMQE